MKKSQQSNSKKLKVHGAKKADRKEHQISTQQKPATVIILKKPKNSLLDFFKAAPCQEIELEIQRVKTTCCNKLLR